MSYEYKVVPAPTRGLKAKGLRSSQDRFAHALQTAMNTLGAQGWEYQRTDTLPCEEREGLMGKTTVMHSMLVFRRAQDAALTTAPAAQHESHVVTAPATEPAPITDQRESAETTTAATRLT